MKKLVLILLAMVLVLSVPLATAATYSNYTYVTYDSVSPFKFEHHKYGIGYGTLPVYSAPSTSAYRAANGRACVDSNSYIDIGGFNESGWLMVRYETNNNNWRVGWVPPSYVRGFRTSMSPHFTRISQTASSWISVSDNNLDIYNSASIFATLAPGDSYTIVGRYNYYGQELYYIEFYLYGQQARGFIPAY